jgi:predicted  nucleic acid-binding Zn-ribbon protein
MKQKIMNATLNHLIHLQELMRQFESEGHPPRLRKQIDSLRAKLPEDVLRRFDHVADHRRLSVAPVSASGACGICHMKLPPADVLHIRSSTHTLPICPLCGGFLYLAAAVDEAKETTEVAS